MRLHYGIPGIIVPIQYRGGKLEYPDDFDTPAFSAGKPINSTRLVSIITMVVFLLVVIACGGVLWIQQSVKVHPFLVSVNSITGQWNIVGHEHEEKKSMTAIRSLQEATVGKFLQTWFLVMPKEEVNLALWSSCDRQSGCVTRNTIEDNECAVYCLTGENLYKTFVDTVVPIYQTQFSSGEFWSLDTSTIQLTPISNINAGGGTWQVRASILTSAHNRPIKILAYAVVKKSPDLYPQTFGFYIEDFNAYKMN